jgi:hypothetical protein
MMNYRMIVHNMASMSGITSLTYNELFGGNLLGWVNDLNLPVDTSKVVEVVETYVQGRGGKKSADQYSPTKFPVSKGKNIDLTEGKHIVRNQERGVPADAFFFPKHIIEYEQFKSSDYILNGEPPSVQSGQMIQIKDLEVEFNKCKKQTIFSQNRKEILLLCSNKPFADFESVKLELQSGNSQFPHGVLVICNNNFQRCIPGPFVSWKKLYIPAISTCCCDCGICLGTKNCLCSLSCKCKMSKQDCHSECGKRYNEEDEMEIKDEVSKKKKRKNT